MKSEYRLLNAGSKSFSVYIWSVSKKSNPKACRSNLCKDLIISELANETKWQLLACMLVPIAGNSICGREHFHNECAAFPRKLCIGFSLLFAKLTMCTFNSVELTFQVKMRCRDYCKQRPINKCVDPLWYHNFLFQQRVWSWPGCDLWCWGTRCADHMECAVAWSWGGCWGDCDKPTGMDGYFSPL